MKKKLIASCLAALLLVGCISAATIASYLPIFEAALNGVLALVAPNASAVVSADEGKVNAAVTTLVAAVGAVQGAPSVSVALTGVETAATQLETDLGVSTNTDVKLAVAILDLSIGTYQAIIANKTATTTTTAAQAPELNPFSGHEDWGGGALAPTTTMGAKPRKFATSAGSFKRQFNTLCEQYGRPEMKMKLSMGERLHLR